MHFYRLKRNDLEMTEYKGIVKTRTNERKMLLVAVSCIILYLSFDMRNWLYFAMGLVMMSAIFYTKEHVVNEKGIHIIYNFFGVKIPYSWTWDMVTIVRPDYKKAKPDVLVEIAKDVTIRGFVFKKSDAQGVMDLAKRMNPNIYVEDYTEEEAEKAEAERRAKMAYAMQRQKKDKKKKK